MSNTPILSSTLMFTKGPQVCNWANMAYAKKPGEPGDAVKTLALGHAHSILIRASGFPKLSILFYSNPKIEKSLISWERLVLNTDLVYFLCRSVPWMAVPHVSPCLQNNSSTYSKHLAPNGTTSIARASVYVTFIYGICVNDVACAFYITCIFIPLIQDLSAAAVYQIETNGVAKHLQILKSCQDSASGGGAQGRPTCPAHVPVEDAGNRKLTRLGQTGFIYVVCLIPWIKFLKISQLESYKEKSPFYVGILKAESREWKQMCFPGSRCGTCEGRRKGKSSGKTVARVKRAAYSSAGMQRNPGEVNRGQIEIISCTLMLRSINSEMFKATGSSIKKKITFIFKIIAYKMES